MIAAARTVWRGERAGVRVSSFEGERRIGGCEDSVGSMALGSVDLEEAVDTRFLRRRGGIDAELLCCGGWLS